MLRRAFVTGFPFVGCSFLAFAQAPLIPPEAWKKLGEILIALLSPVVSDGIKNWLQSKPVGKDAKALLSPLSDDLGSLQGVRETYVRNLLEYLGALSRSKKKKKNAPDQLTYELREAQMAGKEMFRAFDRIQHDLDTLKSGIRIFAPNMKPAIESYMRGKGEEIKAIPDLARMSPEEQRNFITQLQDNGKKFDTHDGPSKLSCFATRNRRHGKVAPKCESVLGSTLNLISVREPRGPRAQNPNT